VADGSLRSASRLALRRAPSLRIEACRASGADFFCCHSISHILPAHNLYHIVYTAQTSTTGLTLAARPLHNGTPLLYLPHSAASGTHVSSHTLKIPTLPSIRLQWNTRSILTVSSVLPLPHIPPYRRRTHHPLPLLQQSLGPLRPLSAANRLFPLPASTKHVHLLAPRAFPDCLPFSAHPIAIAATEPRARMVLPARQPHQCGLHCRFRTDVVPDHLFIPSKRFLRARRLHNNRLRQFHLPRTQ
jgi:hypothetical protein